MASRSISEPYFDDNYDDDDDSEYDSDEEWGGEDEENLLYAMAEQAREDIRRQLRELNAIYRSIRLRNNEIPEQFQVPDSDFKLPREIYASIYTKIQEECDEVYRIHEYESAETIIQLEKIRNFYFDVVETSHIVVKDISHDLQVHTIRNRKITKQFQQLVEKNKDLISEELRIQRERTVRVESEAPPEKPAIQRIYAKNIIGEYEDKIDTYDVETKHNIRHLERRLAQRYERECAWQEVMFKKIPADYIPPEDEALLAKAKSETGVFHLQISESYMGEQITLAERRQRILDVKIGLRDKITEFNKMVLEARDEKPRVLQECRRLEKEIRKVHVLLPEEFRRKIPPIFDMEQEENPENIMDITQEEVDAEEITLLTAAGLQNIREDIMEEFFDLKKPEKPIPEEDEPIATYIPAPPTRTARQAKTVDLEYESVASHRCRKAQFASQSEMGRKSFEVQFHPRLYQQEMLFTDLLRVINYFRDRIKYLHDFRVKLEMDSKIKMVGLLTMISELELAKEFEAQEKGLLERLKAQQAVCKHVKHQMERIKKKLLKINGDLKKLESDVVINKKETEGIISSRHSHSEYLWKVYNYKKKVRSSSEGDDSEEYQEDSESSETAAGRFSQASEDSVTSLLKPHKPRDDVNVCPPSLERGVYNKVVDLRQKKDAIEEEMDAHKRMGEIVNAEYVEIETVYQKFETRLKEIGEEIRVLGRRRQKRMNDLNLMIILRADQIQCMDMDYVSDIDGDMSDKLSHTFPGSSNVIIFPRGGTGGLETRSVELTEKAREVKERHQKGKKMLTRLRQELKRYEDKVADLKEQVKKEMILKYGQEIDLDKITVAVINLELFDQEMLLEQMKSEQYKERAKVNKELSDFKYQLTKKVEENSKCNMLKAMMLERRRDLEYYIWKNEKTKAKQLEANSTNTVGAKGEDGTQGAGGKISDLLPKITDSSLTNSQEDSEKNTQLEQEIENARKVLQKQMNTINGLKEILKRCRTKSGLPPLITIPQQTAVSTEPRGNTKFTRTAKEMPELNQHCKNVAPFQCGVQTIYKRTGVETTESFTRHSLENVDYMAEFETNKNFDDLPSEIDYSSGGDDNNIEGVQDVLPAVQDDFMRYLQETGADDDIGAEGPRESLLEMARSTAHMGVGVKKSLIRFNEQVEPSLFSIDDVPKSSDDSSGKSTKKLRAKRASRKSTLRIAEDAKQATEEQVLDRVRRYTIGTESEKVEIETLETLQFLGEETEKALEVRKSKGNIPTPSEKIKSALNLPVSK